MIRKGGITIIDRLLASLFSALSLALVATYISQIDNIEDNILYYSFANEFLNGFIILLCMYLFIATPVSFYIDKIITKRNLLSHVLLYFFVGALFGTLILLLNSANDIKGGIRLTLLFGLAACVFYLFIVLSRFVMKAVNRYR